MHYPSLVAGFCLLTLLELLTPANAHFQTTSVWFEATNADLSPMLNESECATAYAAKTYVKIYHGKEIRYRDHIIEDKAVGTPMVFCTAKIEAGKNETGVMWTIKEYEVTEGNIIVSDGATTMPLYTSCTAGFCQAPDIGLGQYTLLLRVEDNDVCHDFCSKLENMTIFHTTDFPTTGDRACLCLPQCPNMDVTPWTSLGANQFAGCGFENKYSPTSSMSTSCTYEVDKGCNGGDAYVAQSLVHTSDEQCYEFCVALGRSAADYAVLTINKEGPVCICYSASQCIGGPQDKLGSEPTKSLTLANC